MARLCFLAFSKQVLKTTKREAEKKTKTKNKNNENIFIVFMHEVHEMKNSTI